ncbi:MAG: peptidylprolyl isomerase [Proteobacteria bacterium]|nr:peptidylprolyl isomerase [Pseudomonadota bacterium]
MKTLKISIFVCLVAVFLSVSLNARVTDRIVAIVNDEVITLSELNSAFEPHLKKIEKTYKGDNKEKVIAETGRAMLNKMVDDILVRQEAKKLGIVVKEEDVMETIGDMFARRNISMEDFMKILAREGSSFEAYKRDVKEHLMKVRLVGRNIKSKVSVTDEEIGDYYSRHREDYEGEEAVRIKQILIIIPRDCGKKKKLKLKAEAGMIHKRLKKGESFEMLASEYSQGPAAKIGGDLGFVEKGMMFPEVDEAAFSLENGEISDVIESRVGFHILKVIDRKGAGIKSLESVREEITDIIGRVKIEKKFYEWIEELRKKSYVETRL